MNARITFIHALSPLHAGIGQGSGVIDLPIAREKATRIPFLPGSSLKGALRTQCTNRDDTKEYCNKIFGPSELLNESNNRASLIQITDQRLLLLPVRSLAGTFAWVTSPYVLQRFLRENEDILGAQTRAMAVPEVAQEKCVISESQGQTSAISLDIRKQGPKVYLEDLDLQIDASSGASMTLWAQWLGKQIFPSSSASDDYWRTAVQKRICLVHDDIFAFLLQTATEIITRIRLEEESKTVKEGGLWYEEALPTESILTGIALVTPQKESDLKADRIFSVLNTLTKQPLQLGGKATVGRGVCNVRLAEEGK